MAQLLAYIPILFDYSYDLSHIPHHNNLNIPEYQIVIL